MMSEEQRVEAVALTPCPKCGKTNIVLDQMSARGERYVRYCEDCDWSTATYETPAEAIAAWNTRSLPIEDVWRPIESAPFNERVRVKLGDGMTIVACLCPDAAMNSDEKCCHQWQAVFEGEHPDCWTDGCCWESNVDDVTSMQPRAWQPLPPSPDSHGSTMRGEG